MTFSSIAKSLFSRRASKDKSSKSNLSHSSAAPPISSLTLTTPEIPTYQTPSTSSDSNNSFQPLNSSYSPPSITPPKSLGRFSSKKKLSSEGIRGVFHSRNRSQSQPQSPPPIRPTISSPVQLHSEPAIKFTSNYTQIQNLVDPEEERSSVRAPNQSSSPSLKASYSRTSSRLLKTDSHPCNSLDSIRLQESQPLETAARRNGKGSVSFSSSPSSRPKLRPSLEGTRSHSYEIGKIYVVDSTRYEEISRGSGPKKSDHSVLVPGDFSPASSPSAKKFQKSLRPILQEAKRPSTGDNSNSSQDSRKPKSSSKGLRKHVSQSEIEIAAYESLRSPKLTSATLSPGHQVRSPASFENDRDGMVQQSQARGLGSSRTSSNNLPSPTPSYKKDKSPLSKRSFSSSSSLALSSLDMEKANRKQQKYFREPPSADGEVVFTQISTNPQKVRKPRSSGSIRAASRRPSISEELKKPASSMDLSELPSNKSGHRRKKVVEFDGQAFELVRGNTSVEGRSWEELESLTEEIKFQLLDWRKIDDRVKRTDVGNGNQDWNQPSVSPATPEGQKKKTYNRQRSLAVSQKLLIPNVSSASSSTQSSPTREGEILESSSLSSSAGGLRRSWSSQNSYPNSETQVNSAKMPIFTRKNSSSSEALASPRKGLRPLMLVAKNSNSSLADQFQAQSPNSHKRKGLILEKQEGERTSRDLKDSVQGQVLSRSGSKSFLKEAMKGREPQDRDLQVEKRSKEGSGDGEVRIKSRSFQGRPETSEVSNGICFNTSIFEAQGPTRAGRLGQLNPSRSRVSSDHPRRSISEASLIVNDQLSRAEDRRPSSISNPSIIQVSTRSNNRNTLGDHSTVVLARRQYVTSAKATLRPATADSILSKSSDHEFSRFKSISPKNTSNMILRTVSKEHLFRDSRKESFSPKSDASLPSLIHRKSEITSDGNDEMMEEFHSPMGEQALLGGGSRYSDSLLPYHREPSSKWTRGKGRDIGLGLDLGPQHSYQDNVNQ